MWCACTHQLAETEAGEIASTPGVGAASLEAASAKVCTHTCGEPPSCLPCEWEETARKPRRAPLLPHHLPANLCLCAVTGCHLSQVQCQRTVLETVGAAQVEEARAKFELAKTEAGAYDVAEATAQKGRDLAAELLAQAIGAAEIAKGTLNHQLPLHAFAATQYARSLRIP